MKSTLQRGFTLIELIVVIVILGILAAAALPKFMDLRDDAYNGTAAGVAGAAAAAMNNNYAACMLSNNTVVAGKCAKVDECADVAGMLQGGLPAGYSVAASGAEPGTTNGNTADCQVTVNNSTASFKGIAAGN